MATRSTSARRDTWTAARDLLDGLPAGGLNIAYEAVDRHVARGSGDAIAFRFLDEDAPDRMIGYAELAELSNRFANVLGALENEDAPVFDTIGGLIAHEMGHVPRRGEQFSLAGLNFVVQHTRAGAVRWFKVSPARHEAG